MKITEKVKIEIEKDELISASCNKCGKLVKSHTSGYENDWYINNLHSITLSFGYGSIWNKEEWDFDLCERCLKEFVMSFKIPVKITTDDYWQ